MRFASLNEWLHWQERLHPKAIDLGLNRVASVWRRLRPAGLDCPVITVGGTNGKGSCVALLGAILGAADYRTGLYTSPHLLRYNERIHIAGAQVEDVPLCAAFERVDQARGTVSLTYFEFATLAALDLFAEAALDAVVLEVGLGGRLDAVNLLDADVALVTTVDLDHTDWLGPDRDTIALEKAGIFRPGHPAIIGESGPPLALLEQARILGTPVLRAGQDFYLRAGPRDWDWQGPQHSYIGLPRPALRSARQLDNAAAVLMVLDCLAGRLPIDRDAICAGLSSVRLPGRLQVIPGAITWILDVAHNVQAAANLALDLEGMPCAGRTHAVFACLADKDALGMLRALAPQIGHWHLAPLEGPRARPVADLVAALGAAGIQAPWGDYGSVGGALEGALKGARSGDRILVTGSFLTVATALNCLGLHARTSSRVPRVSL